MQPCPRRPTLPFAIAFLLALLPALPASAQGAESSLEALGYELRMDTPENAVELYFDGRLVWAEPQSQRLTMLAFSGPRDMTGNGWPDLMVMTGAGRSLRFIEVLELGPDPARSVHAVGPDGLDAHQLMHMPEAMLLGPMLEERGLPPLDPSRLSPPAESMPQLDHEGPDSRLVIRRGAQVLWRSENTVLSTAPGPRDMTLDGTDNLLVHEALSRSERRLHLLSLGEARVEAVWQVTDHAERILPLIDSLLMQVEAGESIAKPPELPVEDHDGRQPEPDPSPLADLREMQAELTEALHALGYALRHHDNEVTLSREGVTLWRGGGFNPMVFLLPSPRPDHVALHYSAMRSRQGSIEIWLEIGPHGARVTHRSTHYHGPPRPGAIVTYPAIPRAAPPVSGPLETIDAPPGYEVHLNAPRDRLSLIHDGQEVWALEAAVISYHRLRPAEAPEVLAELVVQSRDAYGPVTNHLLPLTAEGPGEAVSTALRDTPPRIDADTLEQLLDGLRPRPGGDSIPEDILEQLQQLRPNR